MERVNCPVCARSCAAQAKRCLGCGALLARPAVAPPIVETGGSGFGALLPALVAIALLAGGVGLGWRGYTARRAEAAAQAALPVAVTLPPAPPAAAHAPPPVVPIVPAAAPSSLAARHSPRRAAPPRAGPSQAT